MRNIIGRYKIRQGEVKNSIGNGEAKELICTTHEHELRGKCWRESEYWVEGNKGEKKEWDNCKSIINKIHLKKIKKQKQPKWHISLSFTPSCPQKKKREKKERYLKDKCL